MRSSLSLHFSSRCFSVPPKVIFSITLSDTEVRLTGLQLPWSFFFALLKNRDNVCHFPGSQDLSGFPILLKNHWERLCDWYQELLEDSWMNSIKTHRFAEIQLEQKILHESLTLTGSLLILLVSLNLQTWSSKRIYFIQHNDEAISKLYTNFFTCEYSNLHPLMQMEKEGTWVVQMSQLHLWMWQMQHRPETIGLLYGSQNH